MARKPEARQTVFSLLAPPGRLCCLSDLCSVCPPEAFGALIFGGEFLQGGQPGYLNIPVYCDETKTVDTRVRHFVL